MAALVLAMAPAASSSPAQRAAPVDHPERVAARIDIRPAAADDYLTLPGGRRLKVDAKVTYRDAAGATIAATPSEVRPTTWA